LTISIRPYRNEDQQDVIKLWEKVFPGAPPHNNPARDLRTQREVPPELFLVAIQDAEVVGTVMAGCQEGGGWVYYLGVHPDFRHQGIGSRLMRKVEATLIAEGCTEIHLQIWANQEEVQSFYQSLGYYLEGRSSMGKRL
jgi:ribosomal protein S18 acetylase RimI-like enzyme